VTVPAEEAPANYVPADKRKRRKGKGKDGCNKKWYIEEYGEIKTTSRN